MRKVVATLLILCLSTSAFAQTYVVRRPIVSSGSVLKDSESTSTDVYRGFGVSSVLAVAGRFGADTSYTLTSIKMSPSKAGTGGSCVVTAKIYSDSSSTPTTLLATSTNTINASAFDGTLREWAFSGLAISGATSYWLVLEANSTSCGDASNYPRFYYNSAGTRVIKHYNAGWVTTDATSVFNYETYGN